jgi:hypothetical protein
MGCKSAMTWAGCLLAGLALTGCRPDGRCCCGTGGCKAPDAVPYAPPAPYTTPPAPYTPPPQTSWNQAPKGGRPVTTGAGAAHPTAPAAPVAGSPYSQAAAYPVARESHAAPAEVPVSYQTPVHSAAALPEPTAPVSGLPADVHAVPAPQPYTLPADMQVPEVR